MCFAIILVAGAAAEPVLSWRDAYDFDGDGQRDRIVYEFSGGAHCCYRVGVNLSSNGKTLMVPFQFDGGYVGGLDLSQPDRFTVRETDHERPQLIMEIETYNGKALALDPKLMRRHGIRTHRITVCLAGGHLKIRDLVPQLPPCRT